MSNHPVTLQSFSVCWHVDMVKLTCWSSKWDFERGRASMAGELVSVFQKLLICSGLPTQPCLRFTENGLKMRKISSERQFPGWKCLVVRGQRRILWAVRKAAGTQINSKSPRSCDQGLLAAHRTSLRTKGDRDFATLAPGLWSSLPLSLRSVDLGISFRKQLKTHLSRLAFVVWAFLLWSSLWNLSWKVLYE